MFLKIFSSPSPPSWEGAYHNELAKQQISNQQTYPTCCQGWRDSQREVFPSLPRRISSGCTRKVHHPSKKNNEHDVTTTSWEKVVAYQRPCKGAFCVFRLKLKISWFRAKRGRNCNWEFHSNEVFHPPQPHQRKKYRVPVKRRPRCSLGQMYKQWKDNQSTESENETQEKSKEEFRSSPRDRKMET